MSGSKHNKTVETLLNRGDWGKARKQIEAELSEQPENHWLLTQLGVTYYEQSKYRESLRPLAASLEIVPDCPLTLWNIAGALDAIGKPAEAIPIYSWLLRSKKTPDDDPCWESAEWADSLKTDCVYRIGVCFQHMGKQESADHCFRQYINLLLAGMKGTYPIEEAAQQIREAHRNGKQRVEKEVRDAINSTLQDAGIQSMQGGRGKLPKLSLAELLAS